MGDRTWVELTIRATDKVEVVAIMAKADCEPDMEEVCEGLVEFYFEQVNYAELPFEAALIDSLIEYDKKFGSGGDYNAGNQYGRIDAEGNYSVKEFIESPIEGMVSLVDVKQALADGKLAEQIARWEREITVEPLESELTDGEPA